MLASGKRKVLLVSPYPYSHSSRGMDVLTCCFEEEGWDVTHLTYPRFFHTPTVSSPENSRVNIILAPRAKLPYIDRIMFWVPRFVFNSIKAINNHAVKQMDFIQYDYIVLESGKPLFLMDLIPENTPIIYRLSDSVQLVLGKNPAYHALEKKVFERSYKMIFKKEVYRQFLGKHLKDKTTVIENGMAIPETLSTRKPFIEGSKNAVYVGLHQLDYNTVKKLLQSCPSCRFHIIGPCLVKTQVMRLKPYRNFFYYPFLNKEEYMPFLRDASLAIFPFKRTKPMRWFGLTSKFLHFMYFRLPIVSYPTGVDGEFDGLAVRFADSVPDFVTAVQDVLERGEKVDYDLDFEYFSNERRKGEYKNFIRNL